MRTTFFSTALIAGLLLGPASADVASAAESDKSGRGNHVHQFDRTADGGHHQVDEMRTAGLFSGSFALPVPQQWQQRAAAPASGYRNPGYTTPQYTVPNSRLPYGSSDNSYGAPLNWNQADSARCPNGFCGTRPQPSRLYNGQAGVRGSLSPQSTQWNQNLNSHQNCVNGQCLSPAGRINGFDTLRYNQTRPMNQLIPRNQVPDYSVQRSSFY